MKGSIWRLRCVSPLFLENEALRAVQRIPKRHIMDACMDILSCSSRTTSHRSQFCRFHHREVVALFL
jgi:hypothetical protein